MAKNQPPVVEDVLRNLLGPPDVGAPHEAEDSPQPVFDKEDAGSTEMMSAAAVKKSNAAIPGEVLFPGDQAPARSNAPRHATTADRVVVTRNKFSPIMELSRQPVF